MLGQTIYYLSCLLALVQKVFRDGRRLKMQYQCTQTHTGGLHKCILYVYIATTVWLLSIYTEPHSQTVAPSLVVDKAGGHENLGMRLPG